MSDWYNAIAVNLVQHALIECRLIMNDANMINLRKVDQPFEGSTIIMHAAANANSQYIIFEIKTTIENINLQSCSQCLVFVLL